MGSRSLIQSTEYYVIFTQGVTHWITQYLKPNFSHIYLLTKDDFNWILLNPTRGYLQVAILPIPVTQSPLPDSFKDGDTVLHVIFGRRNDRQQFGSIGLLNCVTWAKYILGLRLNCLTPFGLYKRLINLCPSDKEKHAILSIKDIGYERTRSALDTQEKRAAERR